MVKQKKNSSFIFSTKPSYHVGIEQYLRIPANVYWKDLNGVHLGCNEHAAIDTGLASPKDYIGLSIEDISNQESAKIIRQIDNKVIKLKTPYFTVESSGACYSKDGVYFSLKSPLLNKETKIIGILGVSFRLDNSNLANLENQFNQAQKIIDFSSLNSYLLQHCTFEYLLNNYSLSKRETEVLSHIYKGKTAKEIARILSISVRTVETHIERIKIKMDCRTRHQLVEKLLTASNILS